ncbi:MAG: Stk1 family PASTA domain-containing Ser/Thr kinase [Acidipropionibacterium sp.]|jgi:serine/threonine-protein kinase|nr:Stk1 family PASTA domain-containing Ser/Thr kinase [Acidipropionibacterium sp.]
MTEAGTWLGGRYELLSVIGRGGMAEVWKARDHRLGRDVAIKRLRADLASDDTFQARFQREAQSAAGLNHPNIVAVYDTGEALDPATGLSVPYIVMELVEGHTLRDVLRDDRKILPERALEFTEGVLEALSYSHAAGIVHRDIKPANVMLTETGQVKVMDFGIARAVADTSATMTQTAAVIGTAQYLSPEQARGEKVDNRADIYATGCLLYELLVGRPPFVGDSPVSVAYQHVREIPAPPSRLDPEITPAMDAVTLKALAKAPADRYQTAMLMRADIERVLAGVPPLAPMPGAAPGDPESSAATQVIAPATLAATAVHPLEAGTTGVDAYAPYRTGHRNAAGHRRRPWTIRTVTVMTTRTPRRSAGAGRSSCWWCSSSPRWGPAAISRPGSSAALRRPPHRPPRRRCGWCRFRR